MAKLTKVLKDRGESRTPAVRVDIKGFILPAVVAAVVVVVMLKSAEIEEMKRLLLRADPMWLLLACAAQFGHYISQAWLFCECFSLSGHAVRLTRMSYYILGFTAINRLVPTGGASGSTYVVSQTAHDNVPAPSGIFAVAMSYAFDYITFVSFIAGTLLYLFIHHQLQRAEAVAFVVLVVLITGILTLLWMVMRAQHRLERILVALARHWSRLTRRDIDALALSASLSERVRENWAMISSRRGMAWKTLPPAYLMHALDIATIYFIFQGFGLSGHVGVVTIGYSMAWLLSLASLIPSGLGVFEVSMAMIYKTYGIPFETAVLVTGAYRLLSFWLPIPVGLAAIRVVQIKEKL